MRHAVFGAVAVALAFAPSTAQAGDGQAVYDQHCAACHNKMPPKVGDKAAWAPRINKGTDALVASVLNGKGVMRPQRGKLSPAEVKAAVEYLVQRSK